MGQEVSNVPAVITPEHSNGSVQSLARSKCTLKNVKSSISTISTNSSISSITPTPRSYTKSTGQKTETKNQIHNGIIGVYVSLPLAETVYSFWTNNIINLPHEEQLEIGCSIYFTMIRFKKEEMRQLGLHNRSGGLDTIKRLGRRFLDMLGWLIRQLLITDMDLKTMATLAQLGAAHKALGVNISHFNTMLSAVHETFAYYFENKYSIQVQYAMDKLFSAATELMMGEDIGTGHNNKSFDDLEFLKSVSDCLKSPVGKEYLYRYFQQTFCDELVIYLESIHRYNAATSDKERFMIARDICKTSIKSTAPFGINISHEARVSTIDVMSELEAQFFNPNTQQVQVPITLFDQCHEEILRLIKQNHWTDFKTKITMLRNTF
eukprot:100692_1